MSEELTTTKTMVTIGVGVFTEVLSVVVALSRMTVSDRENCMVST